MSSSENATEALLAVLGAHDVRYVVIGGVAGVLFGSPYLTEDLDVCPEARPANLEKLAGALKELEAREWDPRKDTFTEREWDGELLAGDDTWLLSTKFGRLDLMFKPSGTKGFPDLARRRVLIDISGTPAPVAAIEDLIRMKQAAGRERDLLQIPTLRKLLEVWRP